MSGIRCPCCDYAVDDCNCEERWGSDGRPSAREGKTNKDPLDSRYRYDSSVYYMPLTTRTQLPLHLAPLLQALENQWWADAGSNTEEYQIAAGRALEVYHQMRARLIAVADP